MYVCQVIRYSHHHTATVDKPGAQCTQCLATGRMGKLWQLSPTAFRESFGQRARRTMLSVRTVDEPVRRAVGIAFGALISAHLKSPTSTDGCCCCACNEIKITSRVWNKKNTLDKARQRKTVALHTSDRAQRQFTANPFRANRRSELTPAESQRHAR